MSLPIGSFAVKFFAAYYQINLKEAEKDIYDYKTIGDFFTRRLKPGVRPIKGQWVHPVDAEIRDFGRISDGKLLQVKGKYYSVEDLLCNDIAAIFKDGFFITYYLCPTDYHRIHSACGGEIFMSQHIPGKLWPVNDWSVNTIENLFAVNERVISYIKTSDGIVASVKVGATNVGKISLAYNDEIISNQWSSGGKLLQHYPTIAISSGQDLGCFHMGSTVVLLLEKKIMDKNSFCFAKEKVKMGEAWQRR